MMVPRFKRNTLFDFRALGLRFAAGRYFNRLCLWFGDRLIYSEGPK